MHCLSQFSSCPVGLNFSKPCWPQLLNQKPVQECNTFDWKINFLEAKHPRQWTPSRLFTPNLVECSSDISPVKVNGTHDHYGPQRNMDGWDAKFQRHQSWLYYMLSHHTSIESSKYSFNNEQSPWNPFKQGWNVVHTTQ